MIPLKPKKNLIYAAVSSLAAVVTFSNVSSSGYAEACDLVRKHFADVFGTVAGVELANQIISENGSWGVERLSKRIARWAFVKTPNPPCLEEEEDGVERTALAKEAMQVWANIGLLCDALVIPTPEGVGDAIEVPEYKGTRGNPAWRQAARAAVMAMGIFETNGKVPLLYPNPTSNRRDEWHTWTSATMIAFLHWCEVHHIDPETGFQRMQPEVESAPREDPSMTTDLRGDLLAKRSAESIGANSIDLAYAIDAVKSATGSEIGLRLYPKTPASVLEDAASHMRALNHASGAEQMEKFAAILAWNGVTWEEVEARLSKNELREMETIRTIRDRLAYENIGKLSRDDRWKKEDLREFAKENTAREVWSAATPEERGRAAKWVVEAYMLDGNTCENADAPPVQETTREEGEAMGRVQRNRTEAVRLAAEVLVSLGLHGMSRRVLLHSAICMVEEDLAACVADAKAAPLMPGEQEVAVSMVTMLVSNLYVDLVRVAGSYKCGGVVGFNNTLRDMNTERLRMQSSHADNIKK